MNEKMKADTQKNGVALLVISVCVLRVWIGHLQMWRSHLEN